MATKSERGAPAAAKRLEQHESEAESEVMRIKGNMEALRSLMMPNGESTEQELYRDQMQTLQKELNGAYDLWFKITKQVREYDKAIDTQRRDGEKIPRADVERLLENTWRFQRKGRESFIVAIAQDAIHCKDEQAFYAKYSENIRECEVNMIRAGIEHEKFPHFVAECYERSL